MKIQYVMEEKLSAQFKNEATAIRKYLSIFQVQNSDLLAIWKAVSLVQRLQQGPEASSTCQAPELYSSEAGSLSAKPVFLPDIFKAVATGLLLVLLWGPIENKGHD